MLFRVGSGRCFWWWIALVWIAGWIVGWGQPLHGQVTLAYPDLRVDARYDVIDGGAVRDRFQTALRVRQRVGLGEVVEVVAFVATGDEFASRWVTLHDFRPGRSATDPFRPHLRQLYLQVARPRYRIQAGAIPPVKAVISPTGLDPVGWVDGVRFEWYNAPEGTVEMVIGRLGSVASPSLFARPSPFLQPDRLNYFEMEVSQQIVPWLRVEGSTEHLRDPYLRGEIRWMPDVALELFTEALYNTDTGAVNYGTTLALDPLAVLLGRYAGRAELALNHAYKGEGIGLRGELADDFFTFGHSVTIEPEVILSRQWGIDLGGKLIIAERPEDTEPAGFFDGVYTRVNVELGWRLPQR